MFDSSSPVFVPAGWRVGALPEVEASVRRFASFYAPDVEALGRIRADEVERLARETMADDCDALFIACSQLPTATILDGLAREFGRPALSSIQATAQYARLAHSRVAA